MIRRLLCASVAAMLCVPAAAAQPVKPPPLTQAVRTAVIDSVANALVTYYVFPDSAPRMAAHLRSRRDGGVFDTLANPNAFAAMVTRELRRVRRDIHLRIVYDPAEAQRAADTTHREARDAIARDRKRNFYFNQVRILPGNIGYVEFTQFPDTSAESRRTVRAALQFVANTDALIIDLRENRGGSIAMTGEILGYFVRDSAHWSNTYNRLTGKWTENWIVNRPEVTGGTYLGMPITVLTSPWTFSAAEAVAYTLKHGRSARIVGQETAGGANVLRRVPLGNGFVGFIPYMRSVNVVTQTNWDGVGVAPDVVADGPTALLRAQEAILGGWMAAATDSMTKKAFAWAIDEARATAIDVDVPASTLAAYAGQFEEYTFSVRDNHLYSENSSRNGKVDKLRAISPALFQIDRESQVEFIRDPKGTVSKVRIRWNDGWVDTIDRTVARATK